MTRREQLYPEIRRLREAEGLMWREIGERLGLSLKTAHDYYTNPTLAADRERRDKYTGACIECGARTNNGGQACGPPERCNECANPPWTREGILEAIHDWADGNGGVPPRVADLRRSPMLPSPTTVEKRFGSWNAALLAAGYSLHMDRRPETTVAMAEAFRSGESAQSIADRYGVTVRNVYLRLSRAGTPASAIRVAA